MPDDKPKREYRHWEEQMLGEYLAKYHATCRTLTRVRLGPLDTLTVDPAMEPEIRKMLGNQFRRWADAMCVDAGRLLVIETAIMPDPRDVSLLELYLHLVDVSPDLVDVRALPRHGLLVWAMDDPYARTVAVKHGLEVRVYRPSFFDEWVATVRARERRPSRSGVLTAK